MSSPTQDGKNVYQRRHAYIGQPSLNNQLPSMYLHNDVTIENVDIDFNKSSDDEDESLINPLHQFSKKSDDSYSYQQIKQRRDYIDRYKERIKQNEEERRRQLLNYPVPRLMEQRYNLRSQQLPIPRELYIKKEDGNRQFYQVEQFNMPILKYEIVGNDIILTNFNKCLRKINRKNMKKYIIEYIKMELKTDLKIDLKIDPKVNFVKKNGKLTVTNYGNPLNIQHILEKYINEYVKCNRCRSYDTKVNITQNTRRKFYIAKCNKCNAIFPIRHSKEV